jgi:hypothetical protein
MNVHVRYKKISEVLEYVIMDRVMRLSCLAGKFPAL